MAKIKVKKIIESLNHDGHKVQHVLRDTIKKLIPDANVSDDKLFETFKDKLVEECHDWEEVSDDSVKEK